MDTPYVERSSKRSSEETVMLPKDGVNSFKALHTYELFLAQHGLPDGINAITVFQVYEDLRHVRKWTHLCVHAKSPIVYLTGRAPPLFDSVYPNRLPVDTVSTKADDFQDATQVVVPLAVDERLSPKKLKILCETCTHPDTGQKTRCITVAIVDDDSTTAYYRIFSDFTEIVHKQWKLKQRRQVEQHSGTAERNKQESHAREMNDNDDEDDEDGTDSD